jgi:AsmA protein
MGRVLRYGLIGLGVLLVLALIAPFLIPADKFRPSIEKAAASSLGREFKINGGLKIAYWPTLGVTAKNVTIANAAGFTGPLFAEVKELAIGVAVVPLLHGDIQVKTLVLTEPKINLATNKEGQGNWVFTPATAPQAPDKPAAQAQKLQSLGLGDVRIDKGALTFTDGKTGKAQALDDVNVKVAMPSLDQPIVVDGDLKYRGDLVKLNLKADRPRGFVEATPTPLALTLDAPKLSAGFSGGLDPKDFALTGKINTKGPSIRQLAAWTGTPMEPGGGLGPFSLSGDVKYAGTQLDFTKTAVALDALKGQGDLSISLADKIPYVKGRLALASLDLNPYLTAPAKAGEAAGAGPKGVNVNAGWPTTPIDLSGLKSINADLALSSGPMLFQKIKIDRAAMTLQLLNGVARAKLTQLAMYGGSGTATMVLDGSGPVLKFQNALNVAGVQGLPLLTDAIGMDKVSGAVKLDMNINGAGASQQAIISSLGGTAKFAFSDGAVRGVDLGQVAKTLQSVQGVLSAGQMIGPQAKTSFADLSASFTIAKGVGHTTDLALNNPLVKMTGVGDIDLGRQSVDLKVTPKPQVSASGGTAKTLLTAAGVPFRVKGPWSKLSYTPDLADFAKQEIEKRVGDVIGTFLPGQKGAQPATGDKKSDPLSGLLKGLGR